MQEEYKAKLVLDPISPQIYNPFRKPEYLLEYGWITQAACRGLPSDWWFPKYKMVADTQNRSRVSQSDRQAKELKAKGICAGCPVRQECLDYGTLIWADSGIWGGYNESERNKWNRRTPRWIMCQSCSNVWFRNQGVRKHCESCGRKWRE